MGKAATVALVIIMALGLTGCGGSLARQHMAENEAAIEAEIRERFTSMTNFNAAEVAQVWKSLRANRKRLDCKRHRNNRELRQQHHEIAQVCTLRMKTREPLLLGVETDHVIRMALEGGEYSLNPFHKYPIIGRQMGEVRIYGYRQGILNGETRKPGVWGLQEQGKTGLERQGNQRAPETGRAGR